MNTGAVSDEGRRRCEKEGVTAKEKKREKMKRVCNRGIEASTGTEHCLATTRAHGWQPIRAHDEIANQSLVQQQGQGKERKKKVEI